MAVATASRKLTGWFGVDRRPLAPAAATLEYETRLVVPLRLAGSCCCDEGLVPIVPMVTLLDGIGVADVSSLFSIPVSLLFHDLLSVPMFHHSVWSVITDHKLTPAKRDVTTVVSDQRRSRFTAPSIGDYNTPDTVAKHRRRKVTK